MYILKHNVPYSIFNFHVSFPKCFILYLYPEVSECSEFINFKFRISVMVSVHLPSLISFKFQIIVSFLEMFILEVANMFQKWFLEMKIKECRTKKKDAA